MTRQYKPSDLSSLNFDKRITSLKKDFQMNVAGELSKRRFAKTKGQKERYKKRKAIARMIRERARKVRNRQRQQQKMKQRKKWQKKQKQLDAITT